jgi:HK97 family phage prohead protease
MPNQNDTKELRTFNIDKFQIEDRQDGEIKKKTIVGHAAVFNIVDGPSWFREKIDPGAFAETIGQDDIRALFNHDKNLVLGRNKAGTLRLKEDDRGLWMEIDIPNTQLGQDLLVSVDRGDVSQASFAFSALDDAIETINGEEVRTLKRVKLWDVSPVTYPFYEATDIGLRSAKNKNDERIRRNQNMRRRRFNLRRKEN